MKTHATKDGFTRRDFVKTSAAAALGASLMPSGNFAYAAGADEIKVGLIGCGGRGTGAAAQALSTKENVKLVAMADAFRDRLDDSYKSLTDPEYSDWSGQAGVDLRARIDVPEERKFVGFDAYKEVIPLVDVVILATPPGFRPIHFSAAVEAGKHVFMEKPVATDAPGVRQVLEAAEVAKQKKLNVVVGLQRHYQTVYREWVQRLHDGAIGDIILGRVYWNGGGVWTRERQPQWNEMEYQMRNWYYFNWLCGDHIVEQHIHNIDVANWVKQGHPIRAQGQGGREVRKGRDHGQIFDHHFVEFEYADGSRVLSQCRHIQGCWNLVSEGFHGTKGTAPKPGEIYDASGNAIYRHRGQNDPNPYQVEHDELFDAIAKGEYRYADAENGAIATMSAIMGRMATYSGQMIEWDQALNSQLSLMPERFAWDAAPPVLPDENGLYPVPIPGKTQVI
ncbi:dehydrogenase [Rhodothermaceae bacterium RA]|nr:dehydrogenase [Rhodothermaceae bacterium RA]